MIVAMTSIPPRFPSLGDRIALILGQRPVGLCLTIPHRYRRFPDWDGALPNLPPGVELLRADDLGPATKFQTVFQRYPGNDILIADDDCDYRPGWLAGFRSARAGHPGAVIAASTFDSARLGLPCGHPIVQGFAGVLLRPEWLGVPLAEPGEPEMWVDDLWLSALISRCGLDVVDCPGARAAVSAQCAPDQLQEAGIGGRARAELNRCAVKKPRREFGVWQGTVLPNRPQ